MVVEIMEKQKFRLIDIYWAFTYDGGYVAPFICSKNQDNFTNLSTGYVHNRKHAVQPADLTSEQMVLYDLRRTIAEHLNLSVDEVCVLPSRDMLLMAFTPLVPTKYVPTNSTAKKFACMNGVNYITFCEQSQSAIDSKEASELEQLFAEYIKEECSDAHKLTQNDMELEYS